ncbi:FBP domain-containing protein [Curtobacterium sp. MCJR17_055]|uniref:FBP domain-containing protein n=1 Tax=unclassified Curtobacterium TaxID=257496 RepID=UPI000D996211|nr:MULTISPECIES: FBP domain-containing protein [unclassified Curtobacterium]PYY37804.1 FBP domain-containing protein [Curtobacterium sp. MCBD17_029]PYY56830.1 FBP domain-containing protein [Curtobacterium sp. MCJR17_055]PYY62254.1 FBP domain-containing protein [Curtobacterium sp. MCPF17_015]WIB35987.1 FBP domain-containing protein [Curtobacterium sp. MCJR17_043]
MLPITPEAVRASFVNASRRELADMTVPDLDAVVWDDLTFLGWRDPKTARRAYVVVPTLDGDLVGILFRQAEASPRSRAQCSWCQDVKLPNDVVFYAAKHSGSSGRKGNTVGTLVCQDFQCSRNVRTTPPPAYEGYDVEAARLRRMEDLQLRVAAFAAEV